MPCCVIGPARPRLFHARVTTHLLNCTRRCLKKTRQFPDPNEHAVSALKRRASVETADICMTAEVIIMRPDSLSVQALRRWLPPVEQVPLQAGGLLASQRKCAHVGLLWISAAAWYESSGVRGGGGTGQRRQRWRERSRTRWSLRPHSLPRE